MADLCLLGLIFLCPLLTGTTGKQTHVFSSPGENVILPCNNDLSDCTLTFWIYAKNNHIAVVELFAGGQKRNNIERSERLSLGSDCSLNIYKTTEDDYGDYTCRQYVNGRQHQGTDLSVNLNVLKVSSSSRQTEMRPGRSLTLSCQLFSYDSCDNLVYFARIQMVWENRVGVNLQTYSRYYISSSGQCNSTLTTTLLNEDNNTEFRCLIKKSDEIKTSARYTVRFKDPSVTTTNSDTTSTTNAPETEDSQTRVSLFRVIIVIVEISVFAAPTVILLQIICAGRAENKRKTQTV